MSDTFVQEDGVQPGSPAGSEGQDPSRSVQPGAEGAEGQSFEEGDRIPRHRLNEVLGRAKEWENTARQFWQQNQDLQRQISELNARTNRQDETGQRDPNIARIRAQILEVMPELKAAMELAARKDDLTAAAEAVPQFRESQQQYWNSRGADAMRQLDGQIADTFKGIEIGPDERRVFQAALIDYLDTHPDAQDRYMKGDPSLITDWWGQFSKRVLQPFRRGAVVQADQVGRKVARLPRTGPTTAVVPGGQKPVQPKSEEEVHDAAWASLQQRLSGS
jgi:hypothetical protein